MNALYSNFGFPEPSRGPTSSFEFKEEFNVLFQNSFDNKIFNYPPMFSPLTCSMLDIYNEPNFSNAVPITTPIFQTMLNSYNNY